MIKAHMPDTSRQVPTLTALARPEQEPYVILTSNGRPHAVPVCLMPCLVLCLAMLSGCERNQQPGPGPKPMSGNAATTPAANGASGTQATPR
ncbi:hypothetical protein CYJ10_22135 [Cupriavidus pauculus]|uniref:Uncharacterized protein n=1 Tax=Cupriavidus pauculus TaxID=82633 RepID=A0A2N5C7L3_9BURK|nr:hypothetical protein CYJ10_22135 [Cupriavidus pauculus]